MVNTRFLLDTNIVSNLVRPQPNSGIQENFNDKAAWCAMPAPVWHELVFGCYRLPESKKRRTIEAFLFEFLGPSLPVLSYSKEAADWHARERARLTAIGTPPPYIDGQVAAIARTEKLIVVTVNVKDFEGFEGLVVENWKT